MYSFLFRAGQIVGFYDGWDGGRNFQVDMAGFAVNLNTLQQVRELCAELEHYYRLEGFAVNLNILQQVRGLCGQLAVNLNTLQKVRGLCGQLEHPSKGRGLCGQSAHPLLRGLYGQLEHPPPGYRALR
jgi:hypothetical protein